jgi:hypothetical protein
MIELSKIQKTFFSAPSFILLSLFSFNKLSFNRSSPIVEKYKDKSVAKISDASGEIFSIKSLSEMIF